MKTLIVTLLMITGLAGTANADTEPNLSRLKIVIIRHGEKPVPGDNLNCKGLNRSILLPAVIKAKFGVPDFVYVPAPLLGKQTQGVRMFETVVPLVTKYNLKVNSKHQTKDYEQIAADLKDKTGTILVVWEHKAIPYITNALGIDDKLAWANDDFDSIWIVTFKNGKAILTKDKEGLNPSEDCSF
jgi:hypothetical protein